MHDYKPQLVKAKKQVARKTLLFLFIATAATALFFTFETIQDPNPRIASTTKMKLSLPGQEEELATRPEETDLSDETVADDEEIVEVEERQSFEPETGPDIAETPGEVPSAAEATEPLPVMGPTWESRTIRSGDSLANIFKEWQLSASTLHKIVNSSKLAKTLADIHPGETLKLLRDDDENLLELVVVRSPTESLLITREDDGYHSEKVIREVEVQHAFAQGVIDSSLFVDGQKSGLTDAQIMEMAGIFGWDIDFALELRKGDTFKLLYEEHLLDGEKLTNGPILMAEFQNDGKIYKAVRYTLPDGSSSYYDPDDGRNKKRAFIRTPVKFARISSGFTNKRFHPKLKKWRAHRGVDYAAPTGTPVKAAGNGKVIFRGKKGGYGNTVIIQHGTQYTTLYAHLSKYAKSSKNGSPIKQGQVIGYVGKTGLATGPHLHYEFRVDGVHRNPLTVKLPKADPISKEYRKDFDLKTAQLQDLFNLFSGQEQQMAQNQSTLTDG